MSSINATSSGIITLGDATGILSLQVNTGTTALTLNTSGALGLGSTPSYGTVNQILTSNNSASAPTWSSAFNGQVGSGTPSTGAFTTISATNGITAGGGVDKLTTASGVVSVAAATAPTTGQLLVATSATTATWQTNNAASTGKAIAMSMIFGF